jgi:hypothetical protein
VGPPGPPHPDRWAGATWPSTNGSFVYVTDGDLKTDHSFSLAGQRFLTLHYEFERVAAAPA